MDAFQQQLAVGASDPKQTHMSSSFRTMVIVSVFFFLAEQFVKLVHSENHERRQGQGQSAQCSNTSKL